MVPVNRVDVGGRREGSVVISATLKHDVPGVEMSNRCRRKKNEGKLLYEQSERRKKAVVHPAILPCQVNWVAPPHSMRIWDLVGTMFMGAMLRLLP
jgi:hypothetical protein